MEGESGDWHNAALPQHCRNLLPARRILRAAQVLFYLAPLVELGSQNQERTKYRSAKAGYQALYYQGICG